MTRAGTGSMFFINASTRLSARCAEVNVVMPLKTQFNGMRGFDQGSGGHHHSRACTLDVCCLVVLGMWRR